MTEPNWEKLLARSVRIARRTLPLADAEEVAAIVVQKAWDRWRRGRLTAPPEPFVDRRTPWAIVDYLRKRSRKLPGAGRHEGIGASGTAEWTTPRTPVPSPIEELVAREELDLLRSAQRAAWTLLTVTEQRYQLVADAAHRANLRLSHERRSAFARGVPDPELEAALRRELDLSNAHGTTLDQLRVTMRLSGFGPSCARAGATRDLIVWLLAASQSEPTRAHAVAAFATEPIPRRPAETAIDRVAAELPEHHDWLRQLRAVLRQRTDAPARNRHMHGSPSCAANAV